MRFPSTIATGAAALVGLAAIAIGGLTAARLIRNDETHRAKITPDTIVMFGDSITEMGDWDDLLPDHRVSNHGYSGYTTAEIQPIAATIAADRPAMVFILTGTNDIRDNHQPAWTGRELDLILDHFERTSPETTVVIQSVMPRADAPAEVAAVNDLLADVAATRQVPFLNLHPAFDDGDGGLRSAETTDGIHLAEPGYERWAELLESFLDQR